ncbi:hypothetical protein TW95_gp1403 [Pandoravirus inopinatum]|uniref:Transmembrane protein n=1 Tax=Pandoravirus inopinatum TaxID=1605721 RepID=A0A0B5JED4_9VIRU|nr:hypothetical protein TW95_gp1403 [Pandoravirus inopinatum]AJF98137.1 hypothetical protein [Pandoravirus inopinatum]
MRLPCLGARGGGAARLFSCTQSADEPFSFQYCRAWLWDTRTYRLFIIFFLILFLSFYFFFVLSLCLSGWEALCCAVEGERRATPQPRGEKEGGRQSRVQAPKPRHHQREKGSCTRTYAHRLSAQTPVPVRPHRLSFLWQAHICPFVP